MRSLFVIAFVCAGFLGFGQVSFDRKVYEKEKQKVITKKDKNPAPVEGGMPLYNPDEVLFDTQIYPDGDNNSKEAEENNWQRGNEKEGYTYEKRAEYYEGVLPAVPADSFLLDSTIVDTVYDDFEYEEFEYDVEYPKPDRNNYYGASREVDFYHDPADLADSNEVNEPSGGSVSTDSSWNIEGMSGIAYGVGFVLLILILLAVIQLFILKKPLFPKRITPAATIRTEELEDDVNPEQLEETELQRLLREAKEVGNYRIVLRVWYLQTLKELIQQDKIVWKKYKTNSDYLVELRSEPFLGDFKMFTLLYETVWYGDLEMDQEIYESIEPELIKMYESIK